MSTESLNKLYFGMLKKHVKAHRKSSGGQRVPAHMRAGLKKKAMRGARSKHARMKMTSDTTNIDKLAKLFDLPTSEDINEFTDSGTWSEVRRQALADGSSEDEAEEKANEAEQAEQDEYFGKWYDAVEHVADELFGQHDLELKPKGKGKRPFEFKVVPTKGWANSANKILQTINGVGTFEFNTLREFLDSGPYTAREAVLSHIGWISDYPAVYGDRSARSMYDRYIR